MTAPQVLLEDNHCLAVAKPGGLPTQAPAPHSSLEAWVKQYLKAKYTKPGNVYLGVPHRLDRPVSGVVLFARNSKAARRLAEQFHKRQVTKVYWAIVEGRPAEPEGVWEDCLLKAPDQARVECVDPDAPGAKHAVAEYRLMQVLNGGSWLELRPHTGRTHQLRVQAAARRMPIRGDELYGATTPFEPLTEYTRERVIALHARSLTFLHPLRYEPVTLTAPLQSSWMDSGVRLTPS